MDNDFNEGAQVDNLPQVVPPEEDEEDNQEAQVVDWENFEEPPTDAEWEDYIENHRDIGLVTLFCHHKTIDEEFGPNIFNFAKVLLFVIFAVQIILAFVLAMNAWRCYKNFNGISKMQKSVAWAVAPLYLSILPLLGMQKHKELNTRSPLNTSANGGILQMTVFCDQIMSFVYEPVVNLINLSYLFIEKESYNIILNAMAFHFIIELRDVVKVMFVKSFPTDITRYRNLNYEPDVDEVEFVVDVDVDVEGPLRFQRRDPGPFMVNDFWHKLFLSGKKMNIITTFSCFFVALFFVLNGTVCGKVVCIIIY